MVLLLIEDDDDLRGEIREYLVRRRHDVTALGSAAQAGELLATPHTEGAGFDAIVCDVNLKDGDGIDLYAAYGSRQPSCRWILMSGAPDPQRIDEARRRHAAPVACTVVEKPVSLRRLSEFLASGCNDG